MENYTKIPIAATFNFNIEDHPLVKSIATYLLSGIVYLGGIQCTSGYYQFSILSALRHPPWSNLRYDDPSPHRTDDKLDKLNSKVNSTNLTRRSTRQT